MNRRTLDLVISIAAVVLGVLALVLGAVATSQAHFARSTVRDQLSAQRITFTPADKLTEKEKQQPCLVRNAGEPLRSGKQAECYADHYIALHLSEVTLPNGEHATYSEASSYNRSLPANDPNKAAANAAVQTLFQGETLRGLLLTSYGFSILGERAAQAATVLYIVGAVLIVAAFAGFLHALRAPRDRMAT
ncbi:MAG: hypothetical protein AB7L13_10625 [Acidimicrobiia bacterium]